MTQRNIKKILTIYYYIVISVLYQNSHIRRAGQRVNYCKIALHHELISQRSIKRRIASVALNMASNKTRWFAKNAGILFFLSYNTRNSLSWSPRALAKPREIRAISNIFPLNRQRQSQRSTDRRNISFIPFSVISQSGFYSGKSHKKYNVDPWGRNARG